MIKVLLEVVRTLLPIVLSIMTIFKRKGRVFSEIHACVTRSVEREEMATFANMMVREI